jgi:hypothetical protein
MKVTTQHYDPLHYVLLYIFGEEEWNTTEIIKLNNCGKKTFSVMDYYSFYLMVRPTQLRCFMEVAFFNSGVLICSQKWRFNVLITFVFHQKDIRADHFYRVEDSIAQNDRDIAGKQIIALYI